jgi:hypothetical protein
VFLVIDKTDTENVLIPTIRQALAIFEENSRRRTLCEFNLVIDTENKRFFSRQKVDLILLRINSVIENVVLDGSWVTDNIAERGITRTNEREEEYEATSSIEYGLDGEMTQKFGFDNDKIINLISGSIENKIRSSIKSYFQKTIKLKTKYTIGINDLINEPDNDGIKILSRHYQSAPVYIRINCVFQIDCSCCGIPKYIDLSIIMPTNKIALRQIEYYGKEPPKTFYTSDLITIDNIKS